MFIQPATNSLPLQLIMQTPWERLVGMAIADEARIELNGLVQERRQIVDQSIGKAATQSEIDRHILGTLKRAVIDNGRAAMFTTFQALCFRQVHVHKQGAAMSVSERSAMQRSTMRKSALLMSAPRRSALLKSVPINLAPTSSASRKSAPRRSLSKNGAARRSSPRKSALRRSREPIAPQFFHA